MANFNESFNITLGYEGGYSNDPDDAGGETYKGISRRYHPGWKGWALIDELKSKGVFIEEIRKIINVENMDDFDLICHIAFAETVSHR